MRTVLIACQLPEMAYLQERLQRYLAAADCVFCGFGFHATDGEAEFNSNVRSLKQADLVIVLQGLCYGTLSENGVGFVHRLYSQAKALRKPVLCLIDKKAGGSTESLEDRRVNGFVNQLRTQQHGFFHSEPSILDDTAPLLDQFLAQCPVSWVKASTEVATVNPQPELQQQVRLLQRSLQQRTRELLDSLVAEHRVDPQLMVHYGVKKYQDGNVQIIQDRIRLSWPHLICLLGPSMTTPGTDASIYASFCQRLLEFIHASLVSKYPQAHAFVHLKVKPGDFDQIKALSFSLGIVTNINGEWALTAFGTHQMASYQMQNDRNIQL